MARLGLGVAIRGDLRREMRDRQRSLERALTNATRNVTRGLSRELRRDVRRAFRGIGRGLSGSRIDRIVGARTQPRRGFSLNPEGRVYSRALYRRARAGLIDLMEVFERGATIRAGGNGWLAIPTDRAPLRGGRGGARRAWPSESGLDLRFVPTSDPRVARLVLRRDREARDVIYWLVREVRLTPRLRVREREAKWRGRMEPELNRQLDREMRRTGFQI